MRYELAIIGAGPAGLGASIYASRYGVKNIVIGEIAGGQMTETHEIGNWLGTQKISGFEFSQNAKIHAESLGVEIISAKVEEIKKTGENFSITSADGRTFFAQTILLATGTKHRHLNVPGEKELAGKGVSYCATCDGFFFRGKTVAVAGGSDSAAGAAVYLGNIAQKVYIIYRKNELRCEKFWKEAIEKNAKIEIIYDANIKEIRGDQKVDSVILDKNYKNSDILETDGVFVEIGLNPDTHLAESLGVKLDDEGYVKIDAGGKTNIPGVWAAGDATTGSDKFKQIVTAAAEGAIAAQSIQKFLK